MRVKVPGDRGRWGSLRYLGQLCRLTTLLGATRIITNWIRVGGELNFVKRGAERRRRGGSRRVQVITLVEVIYRFLPLLLSLFCYILFHVVALKCETSGDESRSAWIPFRLSMYVVRYIYICIRIRRGKHILSNVGEGIRQRVYPRGILSKTVCGMVQGKSRATSAHVAALYVLSNGTRALHRIVCP